MLQEHESAVIDISRNIYIFTTTSLTCVAGADLGAGVWLLQDKGILVRPRSPLHREPQPRPQQFDMSQALAVQFICRSNAACMVSELFWASDLSAPADKICECEAAVQQSRRGNTSIDTQQPMGWWAGEICRAANDIHQFSQSQRMPLMRLLGL